MHFEFDTQGFPVFRTPIVKRFGYFLHISTPDGQSVSIACDNLAACVRQAEIRRSMIHETSTYNDWFAYLAIAIRRAGNCHVPARRAGKGPTERSCRLAVTALWSLRTGDQVWERESRQHTLTLAKSLMRTDDAGMVWFPTWALKKSLMDRRRILKRRGWDMAFPQAKWLDQHLVKEALRTQLVKLVQSRSHS